MLVDGAVDAEAAGLWCVFLLMGDVGGMPPEELSATLELTGEQVPPHVVG